MIAKIVGNGDTTPLGLAAIMGAFLARKKNLPFFGWFHEEFVKRTRFLMGYINIAHIYIYIYGYICIYI